MFDELTGILFPFFRRDLREVVGNPWSMNFRNEWIGFIDLSEFSRILGHVDTLHQVGCFGFEGNWVLEGPLHKALRLVMEKTFLGNHIKTLAECQCSSLKAWGLSFDLNHDLPDELIACFAQAGFEWGGLSNGPRGHFQLFWSTDWQKKPQGNLSPVPFVRMEA